MLKTHLKEPGIDYPQPGEAITPGNYSFRITAPSDAKEVRISLDDGNWEACRNDDGHWWYDWNAGTPGEHLAVTRVIEADGSFFVTQPRVFQVRA